MLVRPAFVSSAALMSVSSVTRPAVFASSATRPAAIIFDLDGCLWYPDMYMLWGGGAPFSKAAAGTDLTDVRGAKVRMIGAVPEVLRELKTDPAWINTVVGVASCTDEPEWAQECMQKFDIGSGYCIKDVMQIEEIHKGNKQGHLRNIAEQTGLAFEEVLFFDNERDNCLDVAQLGCTVAWVPEGVTAVAWAETLERFPEPGVILDFRKSSRS